MNIDKSKCFTYNGWVLTLYNEPLGSLFHECDNKVLGVTAAELSLTVIGTDGTSTGFSAYCINCKTLMPASYSKVLMAMWHLNRKL